jgi:hypothetical protein
MKIKILIDCIMASKGEAHTELIAKLNEVKTANEKAALQGFSDPADDNTNQNLKSKDNRLEVLLVGSNDILGNAPNRHLTIDSNGRTLTVPLMTGTNNKIQDTIDSNRSGDNSIVSAVTVGSGLQIGSDIDIADKKSIIVVGSATGNHTIKLLHSTDGTNFYIYSEVTPVSHGAVYHFNIKVEDGLRYYRVMNSNTSNTFTLNYVTL